MILDHELVTYKSSKAIPKTLSVEIDSRRLDNKNVFIAIRGENHDGFSFIRDVLKQEIELVVAHESHQQSVNELEKEHKQVNFVLVKDVILFMQEWANVHLLSWNQSGNKEIIGITGSNGKTTTKELIVKLIEKVLPGKVHYTRGNFNNHIGLPLTALNLNEDHQVVVLEMGMNQKGEIERLCRIAHPNWGVVTNIGTAHIGYLKTQENIFQEKKSLYDFVIKNKSRGKFVINKDDKFLSTLCPCEKTISCGAKDAQYKTKITHTSLSISFKGKKVEVTNPEILGHHNYTNLALAMTLAYEIFPQKEDEIELGAGQIKLPSNNRSEFLTRSGVEIFLDAYNANPDSMQASIEFIFDYIKQKKIPEQQVLFILGDMNELGNFTPLEHEKIGRLLKHIPKASKVFVGNYAKHYKAGLNSTCSTLKNAEELKVKFSDLNQFEFVFIKGSRSLQLESFVDGL